MSDAIPYKGGLIRNIYLYLVSFVALMMLIFSTADLINIGLKTYVFTKADLNPYSSYPICPATAPTGSSTDKGNIDCRTSDEQKKQDAENQIVQKQQSLVRDISLIVVAIPVFLFHWRIIRKKEEVSDEMR